MSLRTPYTLTITTTTGTLGYAMHDRADANDCVRGWRPLRHWLSAVLTRDSDGKVVANYGGNVVPVPPPECRCCRGTGRQGDGDLLCPECRGTGTARD